MAQYGGAAGGGKTARERRAAIARACPPRAAKLSSGEWVVKDCQGRPVATGFDDEAEALAWIESQ